MTLPPFVLTVKECPTRPGLFDGWIDGELIITSRMPFFDAARILLARGIDPRATINMHHDGATISSLRSMVMTAAKWTVKEVSAGTSPPRIAAWTPFIPIRSGQEQRSRDEAS